MEANQILKADILDILFEGKNKEYGAYELRKTYKNRITVAVIIMIAVCILAFLLSMYANREKKDENQIIVEDVKLEDIKKDEPKPEPPPPPPPPKQEPPKVELTKFTPPKIVKDEEVKEPPPPVEEIKNVSTINQKGEDVEAPLAPPVEQSTGQVEAPKPVEEDYDKVFTKVEQEAKFPGGPDGWRKYLERNLNAQVASEEGLPGGSYRIVLRFIVDKEGNVSNIEEVEGGKSCKGCVTEAVRVLKKSGKWTPAVQNGRNVAFYASQAITFQVNEE